MPLLAESLRSLHASLIIFAIVVAGLVLGRELLIPLALATILTFILSGLVRRLIGWKIPEPIAASFVLLAAFGGVIALSIALSGQMLELTNSLPRYQHNIIEKVRTLSGSREDSSLRRAIDAVTSLEKAVKRELTDNRDVARGPTPGATPQSGPETTKTVATPIAPDGVHGLEAMASPLVQMALTLLFTVFLLFQHEDLRARIVKIAGVDNLSGSTAAMADAGHRLSRLFLAQALMNLGFGVVTTIVLSVIGVPNAIIWGVLAALMRFVPFIGSFIAAAPPILLAAGVDPGWTMVIATVAFYVVAEVVMGNVVEPMTLGKHGGMSPFAMVVSASFWTIVWGPVGLLLAAPLTLVLVVLGRYVPALEFFSVLLGDEAALSEDEQFYGRLLTQDHPGAAAQLVSASDQRSLVDAADTIVMPALGLAAIDLQRGRIDAERVNHIREAMIEVSAASENAGSFAEKAGRPNTDGVRKAYFVPARGAIDTIAAEFAATVARSASDWSVESATNSSGLTAISSRAGLGESARPDVVVVVTVAGIEPGHLDIILRRAERAFPAAKLIVYAPDQVGLQADAIRKSAAGAMVIRSLGEIQPILRTGAETPPVKASDVAA